MKKTLSMLLATTMMLSTFVGCSSGDSGSSSTGGATGGSGTTEFAEAVGGDDDSIYTAPGEYPIFKDEADYATFSIFGAQRSGVPDYNVPANATTQWFQDTTGISLTWETALEVDMQTKFNTIMIGGDYPDLIAYTGLTLAEQLLYGQQGSFIPLNDLIDNYMPNLVKMFENYPGSRESITLSDGNIYVLPQLGANYHSTMPYKMWINQVWLDNLGLDMPTTTEEFKEVLIAFRDDDPNGNGKKDEVPLSGTLSGWNNDPLPFLMNSFGPFSVSVNGANGMIFNDDGSLSYPKIQDFWRDYLVYMNDLYSEGLVDNLLFSQTQNDLKALAETPGESVVGVCAGGSIGAFLSLGDSDRWKEYVALAPLEGPEGVQYAVHAPISGNYGLVITDKCEDPIAVCRAFDLMFTEEGMLRNRIGVEGENWVYAEDMDPSLGLEPVNVLGEPATYYRLTNDAEGGNNYWHQFGPWGIYNFDLYWVASEDSIETLLYNETADKYEQYKMPMDLFLPRLGYSEEQSRTIVDVVTPMNAYIDTAIPEFVMGTRDPNSDADWEAYVSAVEAFGVHDLEAVYEDAYAAVYG